MLKHEKKERKKKKQVIRYHVIMSNKYFIHLVSSRFQIEKLLPFISLRKILGNRSLI